MGVRVRVRYGSASLDLVALVNTGYETDVPELLIPVDVARSLGLWPRLPDNTVVETYRTASGLMKVYRVGSPSEPTCRRQRGEKLQSIYSNL
jgi:hypothetical protein